MMAAAAETIPPIGRALDTAPPDAAGVPLLRLRGLEKSFGGTAAVHPVTLDIAPGEFVTLLGPSGCGKTTLLRMIAGLERPTAGSIEVAGRDVTGLRPERRPFNMVFQSYALFPHLDVFDNVAYGPRASGVGEREIAARVAAALAMVGLQAHAHRPVDLLSGGMSQRVALVRAIVNQPQVLLLDEPLAALDLQLRKRMQIELRTIQERIGTTFIHVTHDQEEALVLSDRVILMQAGRIVQVGTPREVYRRPKTRFVAEFIGDTSMVACTLKRRVGHTVEVAFATGKHRAFDFYGDGGVEPGAPGFVSLRPQHLALVPPGSGAFAGTIAGVVFTGAATDYVVAIEGGGVRVRGGDDRRRARGEEVGVEIAADCGAFVRADEGEPAV